MLRINREEARFSKYYEKNDRRKRKFVNLSFGHMRRQFAFAVFVPCSPQRIRNARRHERVQLVRLCNHASRFYRNRIRLYARAQSGRRARGKLNPVQIAILPFIAIATILVFLPLANAWSAFLGIIGYHGAGVSMPSFSNVGFYFLAIFVMAIMPAIGEEIFMRGTVFPGLATRNIWFGVLMSGLFFSLMHANPVQTVHQFGLGVVLALVVALSGSIWASVIVHFVNNFISLTLTAYLPQVDEIYLKLGYFNWLTGVASVIVGLALLVCLLYLFYRAVNKRQRAGEVSNVYEEDGFTIVATANVTTKSENVFKGMFRFFKSLFTKQGWKRVQYELEERNEVEYLGKNQHMSGVCIALALVCIYWLYAFIVGMV